MAEIVRISTHEGGVWAEVRCNEARRYVSSLPAHQRRWLPDRKCWEVATKLVSRLATDMRRAGFTVIVDDAQEPASWADAMYRELSLQLADAAYRALLKVLHPDTGGDTKPMAQLNAARDRARA